MSFAAPLIVPASASRHCLAEGCPQSIPAEQSTCRGHGKQLPPALQGRIAAAGRNGDSAELAAVEAAAREVLRQSAAGR